MARNSERRDSLVDAGIEILAREGSRGLTHRAVDAAADVPAGTASNYFRSRDALIEALVVRVGQRLSPTREDLATRAGQEPGELLVVGYMRDALNRLLRDRDATTALFELRLESARRPEVANILRHWRAETYRADVNFHVSAGLPGGADEVALLHYAMEGFAFDQITGPLNPDARTDDIVAMLTSRLLSEMSPGRRAVVDRESPLADRR